MFILCLEKSFDKEPDKFMYFFRGLFFGNLDGINLIADLLA